MFHEFTAKIEKLLSKEFNYAAGVEEDPYIG